MLLIIILTSISTIIFLPTYDSFSTSRKVLSTNTTHLFKDNFDNIKDFIRTIKWDYGNMPPRNNSLASGNKEYRFAHFINIYSSKSKSNEQNQKLTMMTIEAARAWMKFKFPNIQVDIYTIEGPYKKHSNIKPPLRPKAFYKSPFQLNKTILDIPSISKFITPNMTRRTVPLLRDVLGVGLHPHFTHYTHIIYSNMDICVMPHFYAIITDLLNCKMLDFFLNRVEIPSYKILGLNYNHTYNPSTSEIISLNNLILKSERDNQMIPLYADNINIFYNYAQVFQQLHPGYDCVVMRRSILEQVVRNVGEVFTGYPPVGAILVEAVKKASPNCVTTQLSLSVESYIP